MSNGEKPKTTTITGTVTSANERGVRLDGGEEWFNLSKYGTEGVLMPAKGTRVTLTLDGKRFIRKVEPASDTAPDGATASEPAPQKPVPTQNGYARHDRTICREWAVNAALNIIGAGPGLPLCQLEIDVTMALAERLAVWAQGDVPWIPTPGEVPRTPDSIPGVRKGVPPPARAPARGSAASAGIVDDGEATPEPPTDEHGPAPAHAQRPAFEAPPREPVLPEVEPQSNDALEATGEDKAALLALRENAGISGPAFWAVAKNQLRVRDASRMTRGQVRRLAAWLGTLTPARAAP